MEVTVEFAGIARVLACVPRTRLRLDDTTSYQQILRILGDRFPELVGEVISPTFDALKSSNMLNRNGKQMIQQNQMDQSPTDGDRLILMSILAGG